MNNFLFENGTKFLFGGGCVKEYLASFLRKYGPSVLLVTEEGERRSGAADEVPGHPAPQGETGVGVRCGAVLSPV